MQEVTQGAAPRLYTTFKNVAGALADPDDVTFWVESTTNWNRYIYGDTADIVRVSEGIYYLDVQTIDESGIYLWRILGTSPAPGATQGAFYVKPANVPEEDPG